MRVRKTRAFVRDDSLTIRLPEAMKNELKQIARARLRDTGNLALEYLDTGMAADRAKFKQSPSSPQGERHGQQA